MVTVFAVVKLRLCVVIIRSIFFHYVSLPVFREWPTSVKVRIITGNKIDYTWGGAVTSLNRA